MQSKSADFVAARPVAGLNDGSQTVVAVSALTSGGGEGIPPLSGGGGSGPATVPEHNPVLGNDLLLLAPLPGVQHEVSQRTGSEPSSTAVFFTEDGGLECLHSLGVRGGEGVISDYMLAALANKDTIMSTFGDDSVATAATPDGFTPLHAAAALPPPLLGQWQWTGAC